MKIGEFARKYNTNASTIRYYIEKALLTPQRKNGQYLFNHACMEEMEKIQRGKQYRFTLEEIELLFYYEKASNLKDKAVINEIIQVFNKKVQELEHEKKELNRILDCLKEEIEAYRSKKAEAEAEAKKGGKAHVPLEALEILHCPHCRKQLTLKGADIQGEGISKGTFGCSCGYEAVVSDGILICEGYTQDTPFKVFENIDSVLAITDDFSHSYRTLIEKAHLWMYQQLAACDIPNYIMAGPFSYNFILKHMRELPEQSVYVVMDISLKKIEKLKQYFAGMRRKIVFMAGAIDRIPLKTGCIDLYIDDFSNQNYVFTYNEYLLGQIVPLLHKRGKIIGQLVDYSSAQKSLENFKKDHISFMPGMMAIQKMYGNFSMAGIKIVEENKLEPPQGNKQDFLRQVGKEKVQLRAYLAQKQ